MTITSYLTYVVFLLGLNTFLKTISVASNELCHCPSTRNLSWRKSLEFCQSFGSSLAHYNEDADDFQQRTCLFGRDKYWTGRYMIESPWIEIEGCYKENNQLMQYEEVKVLDDTDLAVCFAVCHSNGFFGLQNNRCLCLSSHQEIPNLQIGKCDPCSKNRYLCGTANSVAIYKIATNPSKPDQHQHITDKSTKCASVSCVGESDWNYFETSCKSDLNFLCSSELKGPPTSWFNASVKCSNHQSYLAGANEAYNQCSGSMSNVRKFWTHIHKDEVMVSLPFKGLDNLKPDLCEYVSLKPEVKLFLGRCDDIQGFACIKNPGVFNNCTVHNEEERYTTKSALSSDEQIAVGCGVGVGVLVIVVIVLVIFFRRKSWSVSDSSDSACHFFRRRHKSTDSKMPSFNNDAYINTVTEDANHTQQQRYDNLTSTVKPTYEELDIDNVQVEDNSDQNEHRTDVKSEQSNIPNNGSNVKTETNVESNTMNKNNQGKLKSNYETIGDEIDYNKITTSLDKSISNQQNDVHDYDKFKRNKSDASGPAFNYDHVTVGNKHLEDDDSEDYDHLERSPRRQETLGSTYDRTHSVNYEDTYNTLNHVTPSSPSDEYDHLPDDEPA